MNFKDTIKKIAQSYKKIAQIIYVEKKGSDSGSNQFRLPFDIRFHSPAKV